MVSGCGNRELILPGERFDLRAPLTDSMPEGEVAGAAVPLPLADVAAEEDRTRPLALPAAQSPASWPQRGLNPAHLLPNLALSGNLTPLWTVKIGRGNDRKHRITADPVVDGGRIFTLDSEATVMAHSTAGEALWSADLTTPGDRDGDASGGGLAIAGGKLFATSGFGTVTALDPASGQVIWSQKIGAVGSAAPTVVGDILYVMGRDNHAWAIRAGDGKVIWEVTGTPSVEGYVGGAGPAVDNRIAVLPFASGEVVSVLRLSGVRSWATTVSGQRRGKVYAAVSDISGDPVLADGRVYAGNASGRLVALDAGTGERLWTATEGTYGAVIPVGGSLFLVSDNAELVRLDAETGARIWGTALPNYVKAKPKKLKTVYAHYGPLLAGGRLLVASTDGLIRLFDPVSGAEAGQVALPGGAASNPVVAGGVLYVVTAKGTLAAYR
ncbi:PQQ-like beta-propeller repeat protein [Frigidibacter sp. SLM-1]|nr:PQQ-like beta-propeller repeat protein [Frigidibacter sp. ROC022]MCR8726331.1 PQQ-like beta-propeller repeat protein [Frigidibacter sp. ROC022]